MNPQNSDNPTRPIAKMSYKSVLALSYQSGYRFYTTSFVEISPDDEIATTTLTSRNKLSWQ